MIVSKELCGAIDVIGMRRELDELLELTTWKSPNEEFDETRMKHS